ncbi:hypothetical protein ACW2Q0_23520 [Nocardia sp. R16R-3T]
MGDTQRDVEQQRSFGKRRARRRRKRAEEVVAATVPPTTEVERTMSDTPTSATTPAIETAKTTDATTENNAPNPTESVEDADTAQENSATVHAVAAADGLASAEGPDSGEVRAVSVSPTSATASAIETAKTTDNNAPEPTESVEDADTAQENSATVHAVAAADELTGTEEPGSEEERTEENSSDAASAADTENGSSSDDTSVPAEPAATEDPPIATGAEEPSANADSEYEPVPSPTPASEPVSAAPAPLTIDQVQSFADFLHYLRCLDQDLKPAELAKSSSARIALAKPVELQDFDELIADVAARDTRLATALALMLTADKSDLRGTARQNVTALAARVLQRHPVFVEDATFGARLTRLVAGDAEKETLRLSIVRMQNLLSQDFDGKTSLKSPALQSLSDNAAHTLVLITASAANWDLADCAAAFADTIWGGGESFAESTAGREKMAALPKTARKTAALVIQSVRRRLQAVEADRDQTTHRLHAAQAEIQRTAAELAAVRARAAELETKLAKVQVALQQEVGARRSERIGATSDFETMRINTSRVISQQVESLEDALAALEYGETQMTDQFVRRAVKYLQRSLATLQPRSSTDAQGEQQ